MRAVILSMEDQPGGLVRVTIGTKQLGQALVIVPKDATNDPGFLTMLDRLYDQADNIRTMKRRSANPSK